MPPGERAVLFIDGNNWFHAMQDAGVDDRFNLDYSKISQKIIGARQWVATRYYIGQMQQEYDRESYAQQRSFLAKLVARDRRITTHLGRLEIRPFRNELAAQIKAYLGSLDTRIDKQVFQRLLSMANAQTQSTILVEKAVDVMLAVDLVVMAERDTYDTAYILSADGDYTPAVHHARGLNKKVFAASPQHGAQLAAAVNTFIPLTAEWFTDCYAHISKRR